MSLSDKFRQFSVPGVGQMSLSDKFCCRTNVVLPIQALSFCSFWSVEGLGSLETFKFLPGAFPMTLTTIFNNKQATFSHKSSCSNLFSFCSNLVPFLREALEPDHKRHKITYYFIPDKFQVILGWFWHFPRDFHSVYLGLGKQLNL